MKRRFWQFVHDWLECAWHWVWRTKLSNPSPGEYKCREYTFPCGSGEMGTVYWSKDASLDKLPEMKPATDAQMLYFGGNAQTGYFRMYPYRCDECGKNWSQENPFSAESCVYCGSSRTVAL